MLSSQRLIWSRDDNETPEEHLANEDSKAAGHWKAGHPVLLTNISLADGEMTQRADQAARQLPHNSAGARLPAVALAPPLAAHSADQVVRELARCW